MISCALRLMAESGEGEMTSAVNWESESDSVPDTGLVAMAGFCESLQQDIKDE